MFAVHADRKAEARNGIYSIRPDGSSKMRLTDGNVAAPEFSPGHAHVAYTRTTNDATYLHVMRDDGSEDHVLALIGSVTSYGNARYSWSPDGSLIAFQGITDDGVTTDIFVASPDGSSIRDVTARPGSEQQPVWSPDGDQLAFVGIGLSGVGPAGSAHGVFTIDLDGTDLRQLTSGEGDFEPVWSPDGSKIAFSSTCRDVCPSDPQSDAPYSTDLFVVNTDGTDVRQLTEDCHWESDLSWLPDSSAILYGAYDDDDGCFEPKDAEIRVVSLSGEQTNVTSNKRGDFDPALSPNGRWIAFHSFGTTEATYDAEVFVQRLSDGTRIRVTDNGRRTNDTSASW